MSAPEVLTQLNARIAGACRHAGRALDAVTLIAVSKAFGAEAIAPFLEAGLRDFGENRVQEAAAKWPALKAAYPHVRLHMIGALQSNKADEAVQLFDTIHSLDRASLAEALRRAITKAGRAPQLFVQVNTGEEPQKGGVAPRDTAEFVSYCRANCGLTLSGLMCIPPEDDEPSLHFALLAELARQNGLQALSMGMSGDFDTAIALGATHIRVGSALFGARG